jgi:hypothetical protein
VKLWNNYSNCARAISANGYVKVGERSHQIANFLLPDINPFHFLVAGLHLADANHRAPTNDELLQ